MAVVTAHGGTAQLGAMRAIPPTNSHFADASKMVGSINKKQRGSLTVECKPHKLEDAGANPAPATISFR